MTTVLLILIVMIIVFLCLSLRQTPLNTSLLTTAIVGLSLILVWLVTRGTPLALFPK